MWRIHHMDLPTRNYHMWKEVPVVLTEKKVTTTNAKTGGRDKALPRGRHRFTVRETVSWAIHHMGLPSGNQPKYMGRPERTCITSTGPGIDLMCHCRVLESSTVSPKRSPCKMGASRKWTLSTSLISARLSQRWRSWTTMLDNAWPRACTVTFVARRAASVPAQNYPRAALLELWPDGSAGWHYCMKAVSACFHKDTRHKDRGCPKTRDIDRNQETHKRKGIFKKHSTSVLAL